MSAEPSIIGADVDRPHECDAPPYAYFEVTDNEFIVRLVHQAFYFTKGSDADAFLEAVKSYLASVAPGRGIIFWRRRMTYTPAALDFESEQTVPESWSMRFATSPPIPDSWYEEQGVRKSEMQQWVVK